MILKHHNVIRKTIPMKKFLCVVLLIAVIISLTACSVPPFVNSLLGTSTEDVPEETIAAPEVKTILVVLDVSGSTDVAFATSVRQALSQKFETLLPPKPPREDGVATVDAYKIYVQLIGSANSTVYTESLRSNFLFEIGAVPGLAQRPKVPEDGATDDYIEKYSAWKKASDEWSQTYDSSLNQASVVSQQIMNIDLMPQQSGDISGIQSSVITALNATTSQNLALGIYSDLLENGNTSQLVAPTGKKGKVILVVPSPDGDQVKARALSDQFSALLVSWGFDKAEIFSPQTIPESINKLFE